ncbi:substrate-binding domain-containing protein [bacterium]|nr:substrate-binding domain-containing protein [bacterium]
MRSKWVQHFIDFRIHYIALVVFGLFVFAGIRTFSWIQAEFLNENAESVRISYIVTGLFLGYGILMLALFWLMHHLQMRPSRQIMQTGQALASEQMPALSGGLAELSQGNFSRQMHFTTKPLDTRIQSDLVHMADIFNNLIRGLNDAAQAFNNITGIPCKRLFYVGADSFLEGRRCGEIMGRILGGKGQVVVTAESFSATNLDLRRRGFLNAIREKYPDVKVVDFVEASAGGGKAYQAGLDVLEKHPDLAGIYIACGSPPAQFAKALVARERASQVKVVCHDLMDDTMRWVKEGVITATLSQNSFAQGYNPVIHMYNHLATGWKPPMPLLLTDMEEVNRDNYKLFWNETTGMVFSDHLRAKMAKPLIDKAPRPLRIAVLGRDDTAFWISILTGVKEAMRTLDKHDVTIDVYAPKEVHRVNDITIEIYGPVIDALIEQRYDGFVTMAPQKSFIPYLNRAVEHGIAVGLYNSDPLSLRGMVYTIAEQAASLMGLSENLASSTYQTSEATAQIKEAMNNMAEGTEKQNKHVEDTGDELQDLMNEIDRVSRDAERSAKATENTTQAVNSGTEAMNETLKTMKVIEESVSDTWSIVEDLGKNSERIDDVVELINDIASRVNVLALNAAIEATKAGEFGHGFMVVAREIRSLAKSTSDATTEVATLINTVQGSISRVEKVMNDGLGKMRESTKLTDSAMSALNKIQHLVKLDKQRMQNIANAMEKMQASSHKVGEAMKNVSDLSENNMAAVEQVNTLTREMSEQLHVAAELAQALESMSQSEQQMLAKFILIDQ